MSDELSRRRLESVPSQPQPAQTRATGWQRHGDTNDAIDMNAVRADDEFLEALSRDMPVATNSDAEYQLASLLAGWRHDLLAEPAPEFPSIDEVERAIVASEPRRTTRKAIRHLRLASGAAAVVIVAAAGLGVLSQGAAPGDPLWNVKRVVFSQQAEQTQAATDAQQNLERAESAMARGDVAGAQKYVDQAASDLKPVRDDKTRKQMDDWITRLRAGVPKAPVSKSSSSSASTKPSTGPTSVPPDLRSQMQLPTVVPTVPPTTGETTVPTTQLPVPTTPTQPTVVPTVRPGPGLPTLPPISIRPN